MEILTPTNKERIRANRDRQISAEFRTLRKAYPNASAAKIIRTICASNKYNLTEPAIKRVLYATGTIVSRNRKTA